MMLHSLAARAILMVQDYKISLTQAIEWVTRKFRPGLKQYYKKQICKVALQVSGWMEEAC
jgi:hypothetical protein